jgi:cytochrome c556
VSAARRPPKGPGAAWLEEAAMARLWAAVAAAALTGCAASVAGDGTAAEGAGPPEGPGPAELVAARQAAFHLSGAAMGRMKAAVEAGEDPKGYAYMARGVARWAKALPTLFPEATRPIAPTRARPEIWADKPDFEAKAAAYAEAAAALAAAAASGDKAAFAARHAATAATCEACHDLYQLPQRP